MCSMSPSSQIQQPSPVCEKCGHDQDVGQWTTGTPSNPIVFDLCFWCNADTEGFKEWLTAEIEAALNDSDEFERLPDGRYRHKESMNA